MITVYELIYQLRQIPNQNARVVVSGAENIKITLKPDGLHIDGEQDE